MSTRHQQARSVIKPDIILVMADRGEMSRADAIRAYRSTVKGSLMPLSKIKAMIDAYPRGVSA